MTQCETILHEMRVPGHKAPGLARMWLANIGATSGTAPSAQAVMEAK